MINVWCCFIFANKTVKNQNVALDISDEATAECELADGRALGNGETLSSSDISRGWMLDSSNSNLILTPK